VALVRTNASEEHIASIIRVKELSELGTALANWQLQHAAFLRSMLQLLVTAIAVPSLLSLFTLEVIYSSETLVFTRATEYHTTEDIILHSPGTFEHL
jgi:hypothetical protein